MISLAVPATATATVCTSATADSVPASDAVTMPVPAPPLIERGSSELVTTNLMATLKEVEAAGWDRTDCPHLTGTFTANWANAAAGVGAGANVTLPSNSRVLISQCHLDALAVGGSAAAPYGVITIPAGSELVFEDFDIELHAREIRVNGALYIGSDTCRLYSHIRLVFHGSKDESSLSLADTSMPSKGIVAVDGTVDIHGKQFHPTWDRLAATAEEGDDVIILQSSVNWEVGQRVLVVTSSCHDCPAKYAAEGRWTDSEDGWCRRCWSWEECDHELPQNEERTVAAVDGMLVRLDSPLAYTHFASPEYQSEVVLLSRRVEIEGAIATGEEEATGADIDFGAHVLVGGPSGEGRIRGTSCCTR